MEVKLKSPNQPHQVIHDVLNSLSGRDGAVLHYYYLEKLTLKEIAQKFNLSSERIRQIKEHGLRMLRHSSRSRHLRFGWYMLAEAGQEEMNLLSAVFKSTKTHPTACVVVPQVDIEKLEEARLDLHELMDDNPLLPRVISLVTSVMWKITHRIYRKIEE